ncbi:hypothetical protein BABINDRAFT_162569 [Babjeviella inositovora NRRL Y-12698]|uniref:Translocation protein SEC62 n=1 Tax=Babjeviella inositovora NRRL Y-12698 TaxID=984486 RepID=A0A1E3QMI8_9ASCO|nr:uncharacterized protein BABINDRAFT_162569 [Babjeviella inositovora NRRL Y-12698]ODQ78905.1 hypothetical protein BABINDRAFT_162569 [Babjeviella inositovora NRRL Y-12698]
MSEQAVPVSPQIVNVANFLRDHKLLKKRSGLLNGAIQIDFFRLKRLVRALSSPQFTQQKDVPIIEKPQDVTQIIVQLIESKMIVPVDKLSTNDTRTKGIKPVKGSPALFPAQKADLNNPESYFIWVYNKPNPMLIVYSIIAIAAVFTILLFPLWPRFMRKGVWYLSMIAMGLIALLFVVAIIRLVMYLISLAVCPKGFWLFPNLFEDVGFFDSFKPLYGWEEKVEKKGKKSKKGKAEPAPSATNSGVEVHATSVTKKTHTPVLEEVDE